jgi:uncharacterized Zn finger protein (UPF0148 family)
MMVETAVCDACGVGVRDESLYCYNCGERVAAKSGDAEHPPVAESSTRPVAVAIAETADSANAVTASKPKAPLRSAASLRKHRRASNRQPVEIRWERPTGLGIGFIITSVVLAAGALALILIALYLR